MQANEKAIYLAGPEVFFPDAVDIGIRKKRLCADYGFLGLFPLDNEVPPDTPQPEKAIFRADVDMMRRADAGIFNLTPFRGPSADVGTAFELGFMAGLGKPIFAYSLAASELRERIGGARLDPATGMWLDEAGLSVENFGLADNLMLDCVLSEHGHPIVRGAASWLAGFEACLQMAAREFGSA